MKNLLLTLLLLAACSVMADGPKPPYVSPFSQSLFTNINQAGWKSALGISGGGGGGVGYSAFDTTQFQTNGGVISITNGAITTNIQMFQGFVTNANKFFWTAPGGGADIWYNPAHTGSPEWQFDSTGSWSLTAGLNAQHNSDIQIGGTGNYYTPAILQKQDGGLTNLYGFSVPILFATDNQSTTNGPQMGHLAGFSGYSPDNNTNHAMGIKIWSSWAGGDFPAWSGLQNDPLGNVVSGYMTSNLFIYNGNIIGTNGGIFGASNFLSGTVSHGSTFAVYDSSDAGATSGSLEVNGSVNWYGKISSTSGQNTEHRFIDRGNEIIFNIVPGSSPPKVTVGSQNPNYSFGINKNTPLAALDVNGGILSSNIVVTNNSTLNAVTAMTLTSSNAAIIATNNASFAALTNPLIDMVTPFVNGAYRSTISVTVALTDSAVTGSPGALLTNTSSTQGIIMTNSFVLSGTQYQTAIMRLGPNDQVYVTNLSSGSASASLIRSFLTKE